MQLPTSIIFLALSSLAFYLAFCKNNVWCVWCCSLKANFFFSISTKSHSYKERQKTDEFSLAVNIMIPKCYLLKNNIGSFRDNYFFITVVKMSSFWNKAWKAISLRDKQMIIMREQKRRKENILGRSTSERCSEGKPINNITPTSLSDVAEKQPFLSFPLHNLPCLRTPGRTNPSISVDINAVWGEEQHFAPLLRDKGAAPGCQLCLLRPQWQTSFATTDFTSLHPKSMTCLTREDKLWMMPVRIDHQTFSFLA